MEAAKCRSTTASPRARATESALSMEDAKEGFTAYVEKRQPVWKHNRIGVPSDGRAPACPALSFLVPMDGLPMGRGAQARGFEGSFPLPFRARRRATRSNLALVKALYAALHEATEEAAVRCVVITGEGTAFCAGRGDIKDIAGARRESSGHEGAPAAGGQTASPARLGIGKAGDRQSDGDATGAGST